MASVTTFNSVVAARTRAATIMLDTPDLLAAYEAKGGLASDLQEIRDHGRDAEALSQAQSGAQAKGGAATLEVLNTFSALQSDYSAIMGVVQAVRRDLAIAKASPDVLKAVDQILLNEAEVAIRSIAKTDPADKDAASPKKTAVKKVSQEALRAEIARDALALLNLTAIHATLQQRRVDKSRIETLLANAGALSGKLADRAAATGDKIQATATLHAAVSAQKQVWGACYRILAAVGRDDLRVAQLLSEASRKR